MNALFATVVAQTSQQPTGDGGAFIAWIIGFVLAAAVLALVIRPLLVAEPANRKPKVRANPENEVLESLQQRLAADKTSLEELEYDHEVGAIAEDDYNTLKEQLTTRIAGLEADIKAQETTIEEQNRERQRRLAARREARQAKTGVVSAKTVAATDEKAAASESRAKTAVKTALVCSECGTTAKPDDRFCSQCGAPLIGD